MSKGGVTWRYRADVAARLIAALAGGYVAAVSLAIACAWGLPGQRIDAVAFGTIAALLALPVAAMGCFWAGSALRAWAGVVLFSGLFAGIAVAAGWRP